MKIKLLILFLIPSLAFGSISKAWDYLKQSRGSTKYYPNVINELVSDGLYYASIPYIKEYLTSGRRVNDSRLDQNIDEVVTKVGVKQFEVLPIKFLSKSNAPMIRYILAKKYFRKGKYKSVLESLKNGIPYNHPAKPFALHLEGAVLSIKKGYKQAQRKFEDCVSASSKQQGRFDDPIRKRQLEINKDSCIAGISRNQFASKNFDEASLSYLDISKSSPIWPEILFEEAWNSFYQGNYNRTLGKLVTYKAPVLNFIYNPEIDVLRALTFMELCLWDDTKEVVDSFYKKYQRDTSRLVKTLKPHKRDFKYFYFLAKDGLEGKKTGNKLLNNLVNYVNRDPAYRELYQSFQDGRMELERVAAMPKGQFKRILTSNLKDSMILQRNLIGSYVRKTIFNNIKKMQKTFRDMSYIKLEVLSRRKSQLYSDSSARDGRFRGDLKYLKRNEKQFFWTFNGEFWADELGDYVFALKSECR